MNFSCAQKTMEKAEVMPSSIKKKRKQERRLRNTFFENNNVDIDTIVKQARLAMENGASTESIFTFLCQSLNIEIDKERLVKISAALREMDTNGVI